MNQLKTLGFLATLMVAAMAVTGVAPASAAQFNSVLGRHRDRRRPDDHP